MTQEFEQGELFLLVEPQYGFVYFPYKKKAQHPEEERHGKKDSEPVKSVYPFHLAEDKTGCESGAHSDKTVYPVPLSEKAPSYLYVNEIGYPASHCGRDNGAADRINTYERNKGRRAKPFEDGWSGYHEEYKPLENNEYINGFFSGFQPYYEVSAFKLGDSAHHAGKSIQYTHLPYRSS